VAFSQHFIPYLIFITYPSDEQNICAPVSAGGPSSTSSATSTHNPILIFAILIGSALTVRLPFFSRRLFADSEPSDHGPVDGGVRGAPEPAGAMGHGSSGLPREYDVPGRSTAGDNPAVSPLVPGFGFAVRCVAAGKAAGAAPDTMDIPILSRGCCWRCLENKGAGLDCSPRGFRPPHTRPSLFFCHRAAFKPIERRDPPLPTRPLYRPAALD